MNTRTKIAAAGNTSAPALAVLRQLGYTVTREATGQRLFRAENQQCSLIAEDPLLLLGLAKLFEVRGGNWKPNDAEIAELLALDRDDA